MEHSLLQTKIKDRKSPISLRFSLFFQGFPEGEMLKSGGRREGEMLNMAEIQQFEIFSVIITYS